MDSVDPDLWKEGLDEEVLDAMSADLNVYMALSAQYCKCEALCTCDHSAWLAAAKNPIAIQV